MSYRVDIPTLSANEVYTLTFEYGGTETIQLVVGDLTLETTDRRVVFTTTSPVNYIESNVNLTNLNIYEGYYESDNFGGEYTQESYIEGKSLVNHHDFNKCIFTFNNETQGKWELLDDGFARMTTLDITYNHCRPKPTNYTSEATYTVATWVRNFNSEAGNVKFECFHYLDTIKTIKLDGSTDTTSNDRGTHYYSTGQEGLMISVGKYGSMTQRIASGEYHQYMGNFGTNGGFVSGDNVEIFVMVLDGDKADDILNGLIQPFHGIGCVKSPKIVSYPKYPNIAPNCKRNLSNTSSTVYRSDDNSYIKITNTARWAGVAFGYYPQDFGYASGDIFCLEFDVIDYKGTGTISNKTASLVNVDLGQGLNYTGEYFINEIGHYKMYFRCAGSSDNGRVCTIGVNLNTGTGGINTLIEIDNLKVYKIDNINDINEYEDCEVSTPDDLELYDVHYGNGDIAKQDKLDLTTGIVTRNVCKWKLNDYLSSNLNYWNFREWDKKDEGTNEYVRIQVGALGCPNGIPTLARGWSEVYGLYFDYWDTDYGASYFYDGKTYFYATKGGVFFMCSKAQILSWTGVESYELLTKQHIHDWFVAGDFTMMNALSEPTTEQISINPLKSYHNGSIQTSSQQLAPTLKTTLPISNKFTTTNLSSGQTYNIYFDGTATKLDAGGTIITNPVSPCEVECGGTTLTIEGTDIQNVRVLEITNKNEVGSVVGTTDVELSRIITSDLEVITNDIEFSSVGTDNGNINTVDNKLGTINTKGGHSWGTGYFTSNKTYPKGFSLLHIEFDVDMPSNNLMAIINFNNNVSHTYYNFRDLTLDNDTATIAQGQTSGTGVRYSSIVTKGHFSRLVYCFSSQGKINLNINTGSSAMLTASGNNAEGSTSGYTACASNGITISNFKIKVIENYPDTTVSSQVTSSLRTDSGLTVIWQDMNMSIGQSISKLEQPIKLRSLGTTYDSYNPVTGELTKRIGVSETDGSYSVLSSPIVIPPKYKMLQDNNIILDSFPQVMNSGYVDFLPTQLLPNTTYTVFLDATTASGQLECGLLYNADWYDGVKHFTVGVNRFIYTTGNDVNGYYSNTSHRGFRIRGQGSIINNLIMIEGEYSLDYYNHIIPPHLYTNGQVKVYSDSEVYPTTILNGQSTNNYEVNELNKSNNYTIRYDGECESINLANKSNTQGNNVLVKAGATSGNLTFVNDSGDIDNVLLVQNDVREQEINHFNGLQTVEISKMLIQNQRNMFCYKDISVPDGGYIMSVTPIPVQPGETLYCVVYNSVRYSSLIEYDSDMKQLRSTEINVGYGDNGNAVKLTENTYYIKVVTGASYENKVMISREGFLPLELCENIYQGAYIDLPQPVQLNSLPDGTCDTYNPITGEYVQNVGTIQWDSSIVNWNKTWSLTSSTGYSKLSHVKDWGNPSYETLVNEHSMPNALTAQNSVSNNASMSREFNGGWGYWGAVDFGVGKLAIIIPREFPGGINEALKYLDENPLIINYKRTEPIITQLTPITIPTFESGTLQLITTDGKVFPMIEYSMPTNNRYDTTSWETGAVYTQRNMTEAYFNESTTPMTPTETMTLTTDHISSGSIILNDNGNGLIVLKGNYTGRDIPYFTGMRSVEAIEVETTPSPDQPLFGKGGRR